MNYTIARTLGIVIPSIVAILTITIPIVVALITKDDTVTEKQDNRNEENNDVVDDDGKEINANLKKNKEKKKRTIIIVVVICTVLFIINIIVRFGYFSEQSIDMEEYKDCKYIGQAFNGKPDGYGTLYDSNNRVKYSGHFTNGLYEGRGTVYITKHTTRGIETLERFSGDFNNGYKEGIIDEYDYWNGKKLIVYSGAYRHNLRNGKGEEYAYDKEGVLTKKTVGFWADGKPNGHTQITHYQNDIVTERYTGNVYDGKFWGTGTLETSEDGAKVVICGFFKDNLPDGECVKYDNNGNILEQGYYEKGTLINSYKLENPIPFTKITQEKINWSKWSDEYDSIPNTSNYTSVSIIITLMIIILILLLLSLIVISTKSVLSKKISIVFFIFVLLLCITTSIMLIKHFKNGTVYSSENQISYSYIGIFNSDMTGIGTYYDKNGNITRQGNLTDGKLSGFGHKYYYDEDNNYLTQMHIGNFKDDYLDGEGFVVFYDEYGNLISHYSGGLSQGRYNGYGVYEKFNNYGFITRRYEGNFYNNQEHGTGILEYIDDGKKRIYCGFFELGIFDKEGVIYNESGEIIEQGIYSDGKLVEEKVVGEFKFPSDNLWN